MQKLFYVAIIGLLVSCGQREDTPIGEKNKEIVYSYIDASITRDYETMEELLAEHFISAGPGLKDSATKVDHLANWKSRWTNDFESIDYKRAGTVTKTITVGPYIGDWVADWALVTVTYKNGLPPVTFWLNVVFRVRDGKIERSRSYYDSGDVMAQQGFTFLPPNQGDSSINQ